MNLWKVWEIIRDHSGLTIDPDAVKRFRPAVNDPSVAGEDARHEVHQHPVPPDGMTFSEADTFLADLLKRWFSADLS